MTTERCWLVGSIPWRATLLCLPSRYQAKETYSYKKAVSSGLKQTAQSSLLTPAQRTLKLLKIGNPHVLRRQGIVAGPLVCCQPSRMSSNLQEFEHCNCQATQSLDTYRLFQDGIGIEQHNLLSTPTRANERRRRTGSSSRSNQTEELPSTIDRRNPTSSANTRKLFSQEFGKLCNVTPPCPTASVGTDSSKQATSEENGAESLPPSAESAIPFPTTTAINWVKLPEMNVDTVPQPGNLATDRSLDCDLNDLLYGNGGNYSIWERNARQLHQNRCPEVSPRCTDRGEVWWAFKPP
ncbi:hypothetical protein R1flu_010689 [Riccia fluitans]|uniref:Uncharacterized protein n=1 Tax=Riccia fluitans TaxID=41844 RepID=A0ABD1Z8S8_9MARC